MSFRRNRPLPFHRNYFPKDLWIQIGYEGLGFEDQSHGPDLRRGPDWPPPPLDVTFRRASEEAPSDVPDAHGDDGHAARSCDEADGHVSEHIHHARGSVSKHGIIPAPIVFRWLQCRDAEEQMRHHIDRQSEEALFGDVEMGGPSDQLTVLIWNAGKIDRNGVSRSGIAQDNMSLAFIAGKHHVSLIQEAASEHAPAHWRSFGCVPMNGQICSSDIHNEVGDSSRGLRRVRKISP